LKARSTVVQTIESAPIPRVDTDGVRNRGWIRPKTEGIAPQCAIDRVVLAVGRIVVCVDAAADVSTAMIRSLSQPEPNTRPPRTLSTSFELLARYPVPA
jgi:hypothetical protein